MEKGGNLRLFFRSATLETSSPIYDPPKRVVERLLSCIP